MGVIVSPESMDVNENLEVVLVGDAGQTARRGSNLRPSGCKASEARLRLVLSAKSIVPPLGQHADDSLSSPLTTGRHSAQIVAPRP
jgi:hypothetical protein